MKNALIYVLLLTGVALNSCNTQEDRSFAYGNFEAEDIIVSAESNGRLLSFKAVEGERIAESEVLGFTDTLSLYLQKQQLKAQMEAVASGLSQVEKESRVNQVSLDNTAKELERFRALFSGGAATRKQVDDLEAKLEVLRAQNEVILSRKQRILAEIKSIESQISQVNNQILKSGIINPLSGIILELYAREGEFVSPGKPLYKIANLEYLTLYAYIEGSQLTAIKIGDKVSVLIDESNNELSRLEGTVTWISDEAEFTPKIIQTREDRVNLVYALKILVKNDGRLKIGMPGEIKLLGDNESD